MPGRCRSPPRTLGAMEQEAAGPAAPPPRTGGVVDRTFRSLRVRNFRLFLGGQLLSTDPLEREGAVLCTTIHKFKGLESDVAILVDVLEDDLFSGRAFLYTAAARARVLLHVFPGG